MRLPLHTRTRFAQVVLLCEAAALLALALNFWIRPQEIANLGGILLMEGGSVGLMRAWLGSLPLLLAVLLGWALRLPERLPISLAALGLGSTLLAATRLIALALDPVELIGFDRVCLLWWLTSAVLAGAGWLLLREKPAAAIKAVRKPMPQEPPQPFRRGEVHAAASRPVSESPIVAFRRNEPVSPGS